MPYEFYKTMHIAGLLFLFTGLIGLLIASAVGGNLKKGLKVFLFACHGIGLLAVLTGGFGMAARLGLVGGLPAWIYAKLIIWILLALGISASKRLGKWAPIVALVFIVLGASAQWIAMTKPGV
jgi:hypothetical protein